MNNLLSFENKPVKDWTLAEAKEEIKSKCDTCLHSRVIISENGYHSICCLSSKKAVKCMMNNYNKYITLSKEEE